MCRNVSVFLCVFSHSSESQKGVNAVQQCSVENQKGAVLIELVYSDSALLVLNGTSLRWINVLLAFN